MRNLYSPPITIKMIKPRRMRWAGNVARMGKKMKAYRILVGRPGGTRPRGRLRRRWVDNNKMDLRNIEWDGMNRIDLVQDWEKWRDRMKTVMNLPVSLYVRKFLSSCITGGFSRRPQLHGVS
jgi:hypothetical protein